MSKRFSILLVVLTIVSGLVSGAITGRIFAPKVAIAEEATTNKVLTIERLKIVDKNDKLLIELGKSKTNENCYGLTIYDNSGNVGASIDVSEYGGSVDVYGKDCRNKKGNASMSAGGAGAIVSASGNDKAKTMMSVDGISLFDKDGKIRAAMDELDYILWDKDGNKLK